MSLVSVRHLRSFETRRLMTCPSAPRKGRHRPHRPGSGKTTLQAGLNVYAAGRWSASTASPWTSRSVRSRAEIVVPRLAPRWCSCFITSPRTATSSWRTPGSDSRSLFAAQARGGGVGVAPGRSGGEGRRLSQPTGPAGAAASARAALVLQPTLLLFDEPTSALDPEMVGDVLVSATWPGGGGRWWWSPTRSGSPSRCRPVAVFLDGGVIVEEWAPSSGAGLDPQEPRTRQFPAASGSAGAQATSIRHERAGVGRGGSAVAGRGIGAAPSPRRQQHTAQAQQGDDDGGAEPVKRWDVRPCRAAGNVDPGAEGEHGR